MSLCAVLRSECSFSLYVLCYEFSSLSALSQMCNSVELFNETVFSTIYLLYLLIYILLLFLFVAASDRYLLWPNECDVCNACLVVAMERAARGESDRSVHLRIYQFCVRAA